MSKKRQSPIVRTLAYDYRPGHVIRPHSHDEHQLVYATRGVMTVYTDLGAWVVPVHRGVWMPSRIEHSIRMSGPVSMRTLYFSRHLRFGPAQCRVITISALLRELIVRAVEIGSLLRSDALHRHLLALLISELRTSQVEPMHLPRPIDPRAQVVAARLERDPSDARSLAAIAKRSGASGRTIERLFVSETGMSLGRWRQQLRLRRALERLAAGEGVTSVAIDAGYRSPSAFINAFRKTFGTTPGKYFG